MPIDLRALQSRGAIVTIEFFGMETEITYDPTKFTPGFRADYMREEREVRKQQRELLAADGKDGKEADLDLREVYRGNATLLTKLVTSWDIVGLNGKPLPVDVDAILENLPDALVQHINRELWSDVMNLGNRTGSTPSSNRMAV